jgi:hypothetical protein
MAEVLTHILDSRYLYAVHGDRTLRANPDIHWRVRPHLDKSHIYVRLSCDRRITRILRTLGNE